MPSITAEQSGAFVEQFLLPPSAEGPLTGLSFAVKDLIDIAGRPTGCGNPTWLATHPPAAVSAVCVEQLLAAGGQCIGKTITDEVAFSLIGENHFYGTPLNRAAPDRVPGGSSSGSASAVACGLADFALGTDTGGSVRIPASNCGLWGLRPSHGVISVAGVMPFAPTFDTVGIHARSVDVLMNVSGVLTATDAPTSFSPGTIHVVREAFAAADDNVRQALEAHVERLGSLGGAKVRETSLAELGGDAEAADLAIWLETYCVLQWAEIGSSLGAWIEAEKPTFGPATTASLQLVKNLDRRRVVPAARRRERYCRRLNELLGPNDLLCLPTSPTLAPKKGTACHDRAGDYYRRTLSFTAIAGIGRLPQVSMPVATVSNVPIGLSLLTGHGEDMRLLRAASQVAEHV